MDLSKFKIYTSELNGVKKFDEMIKYLLTLFLYCFYVYLFYSFMKYFRVLLKLKYSSDTNNFYSERYINVIIFQITFLDSYLITMFKSRRPCFGQETKITVVITTSKKI